MEATAKTQPAASQNGGPLTDDPRPLGEYAALMGVYGAGMLAFLWRRRGGRSGRPLPERIGVGDMALLGVATHKLSRLIAKDKVTAPLRAPFAEYEDDAGPSEVDETVDAEGVRGAVGELFTCPYCLDQWSAGALAIGLVEAPRTTRFVMSVLTAVAASDFLQIAYRAAESKLE
jgi:hypothetical protein